MKHIAAALLIILALVTFGFTQVTSIPTAAGGGGTVTYECAVSTTSTTVTVALPCSGMVGNVRYALASPAVYTIGGTPTGTIYVYFMTDGTTAQIVMGLNNWATGSCDADCVAVTLTTAGYPQGATPVGTVAVSGGTVGSFTDHRGALRQSQPITCGTDLGCTSNSDGSLTIGVTGSSVFPFYSIREYVQTFARQSASADTNYGSQRWIVNSDAGCSAETQTGATAWGVPGGISAATSTSANNYCGYIANQAGTATIGGLNTVPAGGQADIFLTVTTPATITDIRLLARGIASGTSTSTIGIADSIGFYFDTGVNSNWNLTHCQSSSCTSTNTGVAVVANTTYTLVMTSTTSDEWAWSVYTGATLSGSGTATIANTTGVGLVPHVNTVTLTTAARSAIWRAFGIRQVGL